MHQVFLLEILYHGQSVNIVNLTGLLSKVLNETETTYSISIADNSQPLCLVLAATTALSAATPVCLRCLFSPLISLCCRRRPSTCRRRGPLATDATSVRSVSMKLTVCHVDNVS